MKKYKELTNNDKDDIRELIYKMYCESSDWILTKEDYDKIIKHFNKLKEIINA